MGNMPERNNKAIARLLPESIMLSMVRNKVIGRNSLLNQALARLRTRLPEGWRADLQPGGKTRSRAEVAACVQVWGPDGRTARLRIEAKRTLQPRAVLELTAQLERLRSKEPSVVVAPFLSPGVRERLLEAGLSYIDLTGNIRIATTSPGLFIDARGANVNPDRESRSSRSLRGAKAGRIVRTLVDRKEPPGVRELAEIVGANPGYVSRIVALLDREALIERRGRGRIVSVDWTRLLERWSQDAPLSARGVETMCLHPRGLAALIAGLRNSNLGYMVTGTLAVSEFAPVAAARLAVVYVENVVATASALDLRITERGANVMLIEPEDDEVFQGSTIRNGLRVAAVSLAAADLLTSPGRGPAEAEAVIAWMRENEELWRG